MKFALTLSLALAACLTAQAEIHGAMDTIITRFVAEMDNKALDNLDTEKILDLITEEEKEALSTQYWTFDVDVPVTVSLLREKGQAVPPFWIEERGFTKTDLEVTNMMDWVYEVWQKDFPAGHVGLGINGFDKHRNHYMVAVTPQDGSGEVQLKNLYPAKFGPVELTMDAKTYHDWGELRIKKVPEALEGQTLITTIRGRAREAHIIHAFRETPLPSSPKPDQITLTWSQDPQTSQSITWRTSTDIEESVVRYRVKDSGADFVEVPGSAFLYTDRMLRNDRSIHRWTAVLTDLIPGTTYEYYVGNPELRFWSDFLTFNTAPAKDEPFTFVYFGDTHRSPDWGDLATAAFARHPETAFYTIGGDLLNTGLHRDDSDYFFAYSEHVFSRRPVMPSIGNHDDQDGLGCWMYLQNFDLPRNGPEKLEPERAYSYIYGDALFIAMDVTQIIGDQTEWLHQTLAASDAKWKFVYFHFPPYCMQTDFDLDYHEIRTQWGEAFDKYHVDIVFAGHVHSYMRSHPIYEQKVVDSPAEGTIYVNSISINNPTWKLPPKDFGHTWFGGPPIYCTIHIDGDTLEFTARETDGDIRDEFVIEK